MGTDARCARLNENKNRKTSVSSNPSKADDLLGIDLSGSHAG